LRLLSDTRAIRNPAWLLKVIVLGNLVGPA
jgi:hypothetical protein